MKILIMDDDNLTLKILIRLIQKVEPNAEIFSSSDYHQTLTMAQEHTPDIAFLDICMGKENGLEAARILKKINPKVNIIFVTSYSEYVSEAIPIHCSGYIMKPVSVDDIRREMNNLLWPVQSSNTAQNTSKLAYAKTFGNFDLLVDEEPVQFSLAKSKEMLAYLIDRHGAVVSRKELASVLFENEEYSRKIQNYLTKIYKALKETLEQAGVADMLCKNYNQYYVNNYFYTSDVQEYRQEIQTAIDRFNGEYMSQYSWAEKSAAMLYKEFHSYF